MKGDISVMRMEIVEECGRLGKIEKKLSEECDEFDMKISEIQLSLKKMDTKKRIEYRYNEFKEISDKCDEKYSELKITLYKLELLKDMFPKEYKEYELNG
jgi:hypothetical protein